MILVTGATGHIGNVLVRKLVRLGETVRALVLPGESRESLSGLPIESVEGDVLDASSLARAFAGIRGVFHLAGFISILPGQDSRVRKINLDGSRNVLRAAASARVEKLVYTSSIHALKRLQRGVIDERVPYDAHNRFGAYDRSKAEASLEVQRAARGGLNAVIACPTGVIGPFDFLGSLMGHVVRSAAARKATFYVDGSYDFVDVRDVADGLIAAYLRGRAGESYILSGHTASVWDLLEMVRRATGRKFLRLRLPFSLAKLAASFTPLYCKLAGAAPRFTAYSLDVLRSNTNISHSKATRELGYRARPLEESIADAVRWFLDTERSQAKAYTQA